MSDNDNAAVVFARVGDKSFVKPLAPCTATLCERIKQNLDSIPVDRVTDLFFDLSETTRIDSTFAGYLVSLTTRKVESAPRIHLVCPPDAVLASLSALHLLEFFDIRNDVDRSAIKWEAHPDAKVDLTCPYSMFQSL